MDNNDLITVDRIIMIVTIILYTLITVISSFTYFSDYNCITLKCVNSLIVSYQLL